jgi:hypothetical protein
VNASVSGWPSDVQRRLASTGIASILCRPWAGRKKHRCRWRVGTSVTTMPAVDCVFVQY